MIASWSNERPPVALVTGASRGIGEEVARSLHALGAELVIVGRSASTLEELGSSLPPNQSKFTALVADLSTRSANSSMRSLATYQSS